MRLRLQKHPRKNGEEGGCGFSTFSSCQNNSKRADSLSAGAFCPGKGRGGPSHLADPWEEEMVKDSHWLICTQEPKLFNGMSPPGLHLLLTYNLAHSGAHHY